MDNHCLSVRNNMNEGQILVYFHQSKLMSNRVLSWGGKADPPGRCLLVFSGSGGILIRSCAPS
jgi:hypothetical protein